MVLKLIIVLPSTQFCNLLSKHHTHESQNPHIELVVSLVALDPEGTLKVPNRKLQKEKNPEFGTPEYDFQNYNLCV